MKKLIIELIVSLSAAVLRWFTKKKVETYEANIKIDNLPTRDELIAKYGRLLKDCDSEDEPCSDTRDTQ